jgi:hypothetical protein
MRYIQDPRTLQLIPAHEYTPSHESRAAFVLGDISPYKSMVTGEMIMGRRQHREHLRQHNCIEVGNEMPKSRPAPSVDRKAIRNDIINAVQRHWK